MTGLGPWGKLVQRNAVFSLRQKEGDGTLSGQITEGDAVLGQPDGQQAVASGINGLQVGVAAEIQSSELIVGAVQEGEFALIGQVQALNPGVVPQQGVQLRIVRQVGLCQVSTQDMESVELGIPAQIQFLQRTSSPGQVA